jgi:hypothetical protein
VSKQEIVVDADTVFLVTLILAQVLDEMATLEQREAFNALVNGEEPPSETCLCTKHVFIEKAIAGIDAATASHTEKYPDDEGGFVSEETLAEVEAMIKARQAQFEEDALLAATPPAEFN